MLEDVNKFLSFLKYENATEQNSANSALNSYMQTKLQVIGISSPSLSMVCALHW
jgi:hypothetical protein